MSPTLALFLITHLTFTQCHAINRELLGINTITCPNREWGCMCPNSSPGNSCVLNCCGKDQCKEMELQCTNGEPCTINCNGDDNACSNSETKAQLATRVILNCETKASCESSTFVGGTGDLNINCLDEDACKDSTYNGSRSKDMRVTCDTKSGCKNSIFTSGGCDFYMACSAEDVCQDTRIYAQAALDVDIQCREKAACKGSGDDDFVIKAGRCDFTLDCIGEDVCMDAEIDGRLSHDVTVMCKEDNACKGSGEDNAIIICGSGDCLITCDGETSCEDLNIDASRATNYKCVGDCPDDAPGENWGNDPTPHPIECYECDATNTPTKNPSIYPSVDPTKAPTNIPTKTPTATDFPTKSPTNNPTMNPTNIPTKSPTKAPTNNPSKDPTKIPTKSPTKAPTKDPTNVPTQTPSFQPSTSPTFSMCSDFEAMDGRTADYILLSDMSLIDGSYNDVCDYYRRDEITIVDDQQLEGENPDQNPKRLRIGDMMELKFDITLNAVCSEGETGCDVITIGSDSDDHYPLIQITASGGIQVTVNVFEDDGVSESEEIFTSGSVVSIGDLGRIALVWTQSNLLVTYNAMIVINETVNGHRIDGTNFYTKEPASASFRKNIMASQSDSVAIDGFIKNLCIRTSHTPEYWKEIPTLCQAKQNMVAEAMTVLKGHDGTDKGNSNDDTKNVRIAYIEFDGSGAELFTQLTDDINYARVTDKDMLAQFDFIQKRECGVGTNDDTDLCTAIEMALDHYEDAGNSHGDAFDPEREKKMLIVSNNKHLVCGDGEHICDKFGKRIGGNEDNTFGVSMFMINVDMEGAHNTYLPCLLDDDQARIDDITTNECLLYEDPGGDETSEFAVVQKYQERKQDSIDYLKRFGRITSKKSMNILQNPGDGALFRRVFYKNQKNHSLGTYIGLQRRKASMNNNNDNIPPPLKPLSMNNNNNNIPPPLKPLPPLPTHLKIPFFPLEMHGGAVLSEMMNKENDIGGFGEEWDGSAVEADDKVANDNAIIEDDVEITGFGCNSRYHVMSRCGNDFGDFYGDFDDCYGY